MARRAESGTGCPASCFATPAGRCGQRSRSPPRPTAAPRRFPSAWLPAHGATRPPPHVVRGRRPPAAMLRRPCYGPAALQVRTDNRIFPSLLVCVRGGWVQLIYFRDHLLPEVARYRDIGDRKNGLYQRKKEACIMIRQRYFGAFTALSFAVTLGVTSAAPFAWASSQGGGSSSNGPTSQPQQNSKADLQGHGANPGSTSSPNLLERERRRHGNRKALRRMCRQGGQQEPTRPTTRR
jgi:hypothetical protein